MTSITEGRGLRAFTIVEKPPTVAQYRELREAVGWRDIPDGAVARGLPNALYSLCAESEGRTVACARIVGDGGLYFYLQDVIVHPEHQGKGVGAAMMDCLLAYLKRTAPPGSFVGLMAVKGASAFYERYGFAEREPGRPGMYRVWTEADR